MRRRNYAQKIFALHSLTIVKQFSPFMRRLAIEKISVRLNMLSFLVYYPKKVSAINLLYYLEFSNSLCSITVMPVWHCQSATSQDSFTMLRYVNLHPTSLFAINLHNRRLWILNFVRQPIKKSKKAK